MHIVIHMGQAIFAKLNTDKKMKVTNKNDNRAVFNRSVAPEHYHHQPLPPSSSHNFPPLEFIIFRPWNLAAPGNCPCRPCLNTTLNDKYPILKTTKHWTLQHNSISHLNLSHDQKFRSVHKTELLWEWKLYSEREILSIVQCCSVVQDPIGRLHRKQYPAYLQDIKHKLSLINWHKTLKG